MLVTPEPTEQRFRFDHSNSIIICFAGDETRENENKQKNEQKSTEEDCRRNWVYFE